MERTEEELIAKHINNDEELRKHVEDHRSLEAALEDFNKRIHLTPQEVIERKGLQKRKLIVKDEIFKILSKYSEAET